MCVFATSRLDFCIPLSLGLKTRNNKTLACVGDGRQFSVSLQGLWLPVFFVFCFNFQALNESSNSCSVKSSVMAVALWFRRWTGPKSLINLTTMSPFVYGRTALTLEQCNWSLKHYPNSGCKVGNGIRWTLTIYKARQVLLSEGFPL